ncbi:hypothetical protein [Actinokineospora sp. NBRC 105648]|uniref:hypothetical protein n=1 Tax=Actinokineospora sp. NBRC 105648 TaxID=3032206 RepID=UPI0024A4B173|nr:hypothetical protein [Actinokineospora sp. NBRC 105648]GLZ41232.1 hypothetical protein Acsp05_48560 [Actinokineospora sp. NBRC 105648]
MDQPNLAELHRQVVERIPEVKTWTIEQTDETGPAIISMRMPDLVITDADGSSITLSLRQCLLVIRHMSDVTDWFEEFEEKV